MQTNVLLRLLSVVSGAAMLLRAVQLELALSHPPSRIQLASWQGALYCCLRVRQMH